jgi:hypothetical protein
MLLLLSQHRAIFDMQMEQSGTQEAVKEFIFTTHLVRGLSYKLCNHAHPEFEYKVNVCRHLIYKAVEKANLAVVSAEDLIKKVKDVKSDLWLSLDAGDKIVGCFTIGVAAYPSAVGVFTESMAGTFDFPSLCEATEKFYKDLGFEFVEVQGRKGWEKVLAPLGYEFEHITLRKRLRE